MAGLEPTLGTNLVLLVYKTSDAYITLHAQNNLLYIPASCSLTLAGRFAVLCDAEEQSAHTSLPF